MLLREEQGKPAEPAALYIEALQAQREVPRRCVCLQMSCHVEVRIVACAHM